MSSVPFYEGDSVSYVGEYIDGIEPAAGTLMYFASNSAAYVKWSTGAREGQIDMVDLYDLTPAPSVAALAAAVPFTTISVRRVMNAEGEAGVLNFLASAHQLASWEKVAREALDYVQHRLRVDASMELPYEQLDQTEIDRVIALGARILLRDAFGTGEVT